MLSDGSERLVLLSDSVVWNKVRCIVNKLNKQKLTIPLIINYFDNFQSIINNEYLYSCSRFFSDTTFLGLGYFLTYMLTFEEVQVFHLILLPYILQQVVLDELCNRDERPFYCIQGKGKVMLIYLLELKFSLSFKSCVFILANSFLCLLPKHPKYSSLFNVINFNYFFAEISGRYLINILFVIDRNIFQLQKLRRILSYFNYCQSVQHKIDDGLHITRRFLSSVYSFNSFNVFDSKKFGGLLYEALKSTKLPYFLVDFNHFSEQFAHEKCIPMVKQILF